MNRIATGLVLAVTAGWSAPPTAVAEEQASDPARMTVASAGIFEVAPDEGPALILLHVRLTLANDGTRTPWRFDPPATRIDLGRDGVTRPVLVNADVATLPIILIDPGARVTVDLFAVVPARVLARPDGIDRVTVRTRIATPDERRVLIASYARPAPTFAWVALATTDAATVGTAPHWWASPHYPWQTVRRADGPLHALVPSSAVVHRRNTRRTRAARRFAAAAPRRARSSSMVSGPAT